MKIFAVVRNGPMADNIRRAILAHGQLYQEAIQAGDLGVAEDRMRTIVALEEWLQLMVPRAGIEPALLSETDFESAASTSSANGATTGDYSKGCPEVKCGETLPQSTQSDLKDCPEFLYRLADLMSYIQLPHGWTLRVSCMDKNSERLCLQVEDNNGVCNVTGKPDPWRGRKWPLSEFMTDGEIINTVWKAVLTAAEHELREGFKFKGVTIYDPHFDPHSLVDFMKTKGSRKWRDDGMTEVA